MWRAPGMKPMSKPGFSSSWLDLREPADHAARDASLLSRAAQCATDGAVIVDLGSGTGSTARAFNGKMTNGDWRFVDSDHRLLALAGQRHPGSEQLCADLKEIDTLNFDGAGLVTASALLDLMPARWIETLAKRLKAARVPLYAALNYNGAMEWSPALADDSSITASFNAHQLTDKGIGPAAGPNAADVTAHIFRSHGFTVSMADSPWILGAGHAALIEELLVGISKAATETGHAGADDWLQQRRGLLSASTVQIGHTDILAVPR